MGERIELTDSIMTMIIKLSDGNPGVINVLMQSIYNGPIIDPDSAFGPMSVMIGLDSHGIYGHRIWMFYKDVCGEKIFNLIDLLRAVQLGITTESKLNSAIDGIWQGDDLETLIKAVKKELPNFGNGEVK